MLLIKNATLVGMAEINYEITDILADGPKILKIGMLNPSDYPTATVIDANNRLVTPGLVDAHCHIGLEEDIIGRVGDDVNEMSGPVLPELRGIDSIKPHDPSFAHAVAAGITTVVTGPGSADVIGGTFCALKTTGKTIFDMILKEEVAMKMALGENPKGVFGPNKQIPGTRMASAALLREALFKAREYDQKKKTYEKELAAGKENPIKPDFNMRWESLSRVFDGFLVKIHAHQADDITTAMRIIEEFGLNATIEHCTEGYLIADTLAARKQRCIIGPVFGTRSKMELRNMSFDSGKVLLDHGVEFAIMTDHPVIPIQNTMTQAALFVKAGMPVFDVLKSLTINAARLAGIDDRVGSIEIGKDADLVIWSGDPFHYMTSPDYVIINGKVVS